MSILVIDSDCFAMGNIVTLCQAEFPGESVLGARNGWFALGLCRLCSPDLIVLEIELCDCDGLALIPQLRRVSPTVKILGFSGSCDQHTAHRIRGATLDGYMCKRYTFANDLISGMRRVLAGERYFDPFIRDVQSQMRKDSSAFNTMLSDREIELLGEMGAGLTNEEVARKFRVSVSTVNNHRHSIMAKLGLHRSTELMRFAAENGITRFCQDWDRNHLRASRPPGRRWDVFRSFPSASQENAQASGRGG